MNMNRKSYKTATKEEAWRIVDEIFPTDYELDPIRTSGAGYNIYSSTASEGFSYFYICDLNDRLEVNMGAATVNIWIETADEVRKQLAEVTKRLYPNRV